MKLNEILMDDMIIYNFDSINDVKSTIKYFGITKWEGNTDIDETNIKWGFNYIKDSILFVQKGKISYDNGAFSLRNKSLEEQKSFIKNKYKNRDTLHLISKFIDYRRLKIEKLNELIKKVN